MSNMAVSTEQAGSLPVDPPIGGDWTVDLLDQLPDDNLKYEILDGVLLVSPSPIPRHQRAIPWLADDPQRRMPGRSRSLHRTAGLAPGQPHSLEPDLLVVAKDRRREEHPAEPGDRSGGAVPEFATVRPAAEFCPYAEAGIGQHWIGDPDRPSVVTPVGGFVQAVGSPR